MEIGIETNKILGRAWVKKLPYFSIDNARIIYTKKV